ncbi:MULTISPECIES: TolC family outer membrane protein [unclassified Variovorax]|uniref:TolC family outer membrane protein n=1 Tax=unclassified Variovorax TaxID=663243 RepID=UPI001F0B94EF|nr:MULTISPECIES: TolC family outer membrane protein [unclassified Variovorax]
MKSSTTLCMAAWLSLACLPTAAQVEPIELKSARSLAPSTLAQELGSAGPAPVLQPQAQAAAENAKPLELADAVRRAVGRHPSISDAIATLAQQSDGVEVARAGYYPQVRFGAGSGFNGGGSASARRRGTGVLATASVSQMLYDFGKVSGAVDQSEAQVRRQQATVLRQIDAVAQQTADAVVRAHRYQSLVAIAQEQVAAVEKVLETAKLRATSGLSTKADPIQAESRVDSARANLLHVTSQLAQSRERLVTLLGGPAPALIAPLPQRLASEPRVDQLPPDARLMPEVLVAEAERRVAAAQLDIAKAQRYPTVSLDVSASKALGGVNPATQERNGTNHAVMINLTSAVYQGGAQDAQVRAALAAEEAARMRIEAARLNLGDQVRSLREQAIGAQARLGVLAERRRSIVEARDLYREQYTLGTRSILDLLNAEQEIHQAAADQEAVLHDLWESRIGYIGATGQGRAYYGLNNTVVQGMELLP